MQLDAYVRVSRVAGRSGESFISPDDQRDRIVAWAKANGHEIIKVHDELDVSGGTTDRPHLNEVMRRIEAGETGGIVVAKLDRLGRTLVDTLQLIKRIKDKEALFASVADSFDITTPTGNLVLNMMLSIAQWELERIGISWDESRSRAIARKVYIGPRPPFGYRVVRNKEGKEPRLEKDPVTAPIVTELFERRAAGESWHSLGKWLREASPGGEAWSMGSLYRTLSRRTYLGTVYHGKHEKEGAHPPLTDPATFQAVQGMRVPRHPLKYGDKHLLRGLVRCSSCRYTMQLASTGGGERANGKQKKGPVYRCFRHDQVGDCPSATAISVNGGPKSIGLDDYVVDQLFERLPEIEAEAFGADTEIGDLEDELRLTKAELARYLSDTELLETVGREAFMAGAEARRGKVDAAQADLDEALRQAGGRQATRNLREDWADMPIIERREALSQAIQAVFVRPTNHPQMERHRRRSGGPGIQGASEHRICIVWATDPPADIPRQGRRDYVLHPFPFPGDAD